ncbi:HET-domain-containing protein [Pyrenochaeta sp. DS3sAY3a]|nr:HET-domain-containing protein [Pyrenochaeta sp. DS3sAY3a]
MASTPGFCDFCYANVLGVKTSWGYHHPSASSLTNSAQRGCTFCTLLHKDVLMLRSTLHTIKHQDAGLKRFLHEHVAKTDNLQRGQGSSTSLYRWSIRSLGRSRESTHQVTITFRVVPQRVVYGDNESQEQGPQTFGLPERAFHCFLEEELEGLLSAAELGTSTNPALNGGQQIRDWIRTCGIEHKNCPKRAGSASKFIPTRLLHIGGKRAGDRLLVVNTKLNNVKGPYVTLSHCWGKDPLVTLRSSTLEEFMFVGVPWRKLSVNFQQAIQVAWFLEIDYIWIDSLCIMQGDIEDWNHEGSRMEKVYRNSFCNIAAADAGDSTGGLFRQREAQNVMPALLELPDETPIFGSRRWVVLRSDLWDQGLLGKPLYKRGWVYQERMLAPRILHFSKHQLFWDCTEMSACETLPAGLPLPLDQQSARDRHWRGRLQENIRGTRLLSGLNDDSLDDLWTSTVKNYTSLDLSNQTDKRMAIWGVVKRLREMQREEYVAGMWEQALEEQLAWRVADCVVSKRPRELEINPTWSWTSIKGTILTTSRSERWQRSYVVRDHTGNKIWFDLGDQGIKPGLPKERSESANDMARELKLANERRQTSSTAPSKGPQAEVFDSADVAQIPRPPLRSRTSSPPRTELTLRSNQIAQYSSTSKDPHTITDERREKEPALRNTRIAMQGFLHVGRLKRGRFSACWSFEIPHAHDKTLEMNAFPDIDPGSDSLETLFVVLALTKHSNRVEEDDLVEKIWYEGHGILLQETNVAWCFQRTGALGIRHLSYDTWQLLQTTSSSLKRSTMQVDKNPCKNFFLE